MNANAYISLDLINMIYTYILYKEIQFTKEKVYY